MRWLSAAVVVVLVAVGFYFLVDNLVIIKPEAYSLPPLPVLTINRKLLGAEHLFQGDWVGPEALTLDPSGRLLYTGLLDGRIVRWDGQSDTYEVFARTGEVLPNCGVPELEPQCGRPLGLHFDTQGNLIVADAYKGLLSINPRGEITTLLTSVEGAPLVFPNDLAIGADGTIYLTDSSVYQRRDFMLDLLEGGAKGRLVAYYPSNGTAKVVLSGLHFPNGITWHTDNRSLLFPELTRFRIMRFYPEDGKVEVFADNLFGSPDNIRPREREGRVTFLVGMGVKRSQPFSFAQLIAPMPFVRSLLSLIPYKIVLGTIPPHGLITELDEQGAIVDTWQDPTGRTSWLSEGLEWRGYLYLASFRNAFLARVKL